MPKQTKKFPTQELVTVTTGATVAAAAAILQDHGLRHLPVINSENEIVGVLSKRDLPQKKNRLDLIVDDVMTSPLLSIDQHAPLRSAIFKLIKNESSSLLVVNDEKNVVGVITTEDLLWYLHSLLEDTRDKRFSFSNLFDLQTVSEAVQQIGRTEKMRAL